MTAKHRMPSHPGEILKELYMDPLGLTQVKLAEHLGCTRAAVNEIINGRRGVSPEMACKLGDAFNTTPQLWMNLQTDYDLVQALKSHRKLSALSA